jgi:hypothetical protein
MKDIFGIKNKDLAERLIKLIMCPSKLQKDYIKNLYIELDDYMIFVFNLFLARQERRMKIIFDLCDFDRDGTISSLDLINLRDCAPESSLFY